MKAMLGEPTDPNIYDNQPAAEQEGDLQRERRREKSLEDVNGVAREVMQHIEEQGEDWNDARVINRIGNNVISGLNEFFDKKYGLSVSEENLPATVTWFNPDEAVAYVKLCQYKKDGKQVKIENVIAVPTINEVLNGNTMSEELGHFYRCQFEPRNQTNEEITHEFFGLLGMRLFKKLGGKEELGGLWFLAGHEEQFEAGLKKFALAISRAIKNKATLDKILGGSGELSAQDKEERRDWIVHQRGYEWASKVDIDKIKNWEKLFFLPNQEIRKRFFTDKPDYSGL